jgi:polysaccharide biosynthesis transport protein
MDATVGPVNCVSDSGRSLKMLQTQQSSPVQDMPAPVPEEAGLADLASFAIGIARRQYLIILFVALIATFLGVAYVRIAPPTFTAKAQIIIDRGKSSFLQQQAVLPDSPIDSPQVESQIQILTSNRLAASVVKSLHLTEDPEFVGTGGALLESLRLRLGNFLGGLGLDVFGPQERTESDSSSVREAADGLLRNIQVGRLGISFIIELSYRSHNAERAAQIANAIAEAYVADQMDAKYDAQRRASDWLQRRVTELRQQAGTSEDAVNAYKAANNMVAAGGTLLKEQEVAELNRQLVVAREKTSEALARLNRIESVLRRGDSGGTSGRDGRSDSPADGIVSDVFGNPIITKLRQQYLELVNREADFSARYGKDHAAVVNLRNQIRDIRNSILDELRRMAESFKSDYLISKQRQESLEKDLANSVAQSQDTKKAESALRELESNAQSARSLYDMFLQRYMESLQQQTYVTTESRIISPAAPPRQKSSPKTTLVLALSVLGGLGAGIGLGFLRDTMDRVFRTGDQIERVLRVPCIALLPLLKESPERTQTSRPSEAAFNGQQTICRDASMFWTVVDAPLSGFAEGIRSVKLAADLQRLNGLSVVIGLTSSVPNEGKSTTAASLALLIGQVGYRVVVVDCDLRNPSLTRALAPNATIGIVEVLAGEKSVEEASWRCPVTNVAFLPAPQTSRLLHTSEILASASAKKLFEHLRMSYDYIVVDLPPLAPIVDVRATGHLVDFYLLVVEWGSTKIDVVQHALGKARPVYESLVGAILNKTDMNRIGRYDMRREEYYDNKHYSRYGYTT